MHEVLLQSLSRITPSLSGNVKLIDADIISNSKHINILAIISDSKLIGDIRFREIITYLYSHSASEKTLKEVLNIPIKTLMNKNIIKIPVNNDFNNIFQKLKDSKNKIVFLTDSDDSLQGYISISDLVPWALKIIPSSSTIHEHFPQHDLISASPYDTISDIAELMINHHIRRVVIKDKSLKIIDYKKLKKMFSIKDFQNKTIKSFFALPVESFTHDVVRINSNSQIQILSRLFTQGVDCFVTDKDRIITSWDIVMAANNILQEQK